MSLGVGAMIHYLGGGSEHSSDEYKDKVIKQIWIDNDRLHIDFEDGKKIDIWDNGQSCCEYRFMTCDDDLQYLVGKKLVHIVSKPGSDHEGEYGECHEEVFVEVMTNDGFITITNHNQHNGYYGGFGLTITER